MPTEVNDSLVALVIVDKLATVDDFGSDAGFMVLRSYDNSVLVSFSTFGVETVSKTDPFIVGICPFETSDVCSGTEVVLAVVT